MNDSADNPIVDVLVVGAGFSGMYAAIDARRRGLTVTGVEAGSGCGGTWYWNRYPGARCDLESLDYSYSFDEELQQEWRWSERYATQPEILRYVEHVAAKYRLDEIFTFGVTVTGAHFDEEAACWVLDSDDGTERRGRYLFLATGSLSTPNVPPIAGLDSFGGEILLTAQWPEDVDLVGKRIGVIGTGSSGIQSIPILAEAARQLTVFQRTANYSVPVLNRDLSDDDFAREAAAYPERRRIAWQSMAGTLSAAYPKDAFEVDETERLAALEQRWNEGGVLFGKTFPDQTVDPAVNQLAADFAAAKIRDIVQDPAVADDLVPNDHPIGTKRICTDSGYFATFNRDNVTLVNLRREPIEEFTHNGVRTTERTIELDVVVLATGFDALTGSITRLDIKSPAGETIAESWAEGPTTYLGMAVPGFPNLFILNGPGSPGVFSNVIMAGELQVNWLLDLVEHCDASGWSTVQPRYDAAVAWTDHVSEVAAGTLLMQADSWYLGANIEGKPRVFMVYAGGFRPYGDRCDDVRDRGYAGFVFGR